MMMRKPILWAFMALIATACGNKTNSNEAPTDDEPSAKTEQQAPNTVNADDPRAAWTFSTSLHKDANGQCDALVLSCKKGETTQDFTFEFNWPKDQDILEDDEAGLIAEDDINFDGKPDVVVRLGDFGVSPSSPMFFYGACTWNESAQRFEVVENYSEIANPQLDKKTIASQYQAADGSSHTDYYEWKDGQLVQTNGDNNEPAE